MQNEGKTWELSLLDPFSITETVREWEGIPHFPESRNVLMLYKHEEKSELQTLIQHSRICLRPIYYEKTLNAFPVAHQSHNIYQGMPILMSSAQWLPSPPDALQFHPHSVPGLPSFRQGLLQKRMLVFHQAVSGYPQELSKVHRARTQCGNKVMMQKSGTLLPSAQLRCATRKYLKGQHKEGEEGHQNRGSSLFLGRHGEQCLKTMQAAHSNVPTLSRTQALLPAQLSYVPCTG